MCHSNLKEKRLKNLPQSKFLKKYAPIICHLTNQIVFSRHNSSFTAWRGHYRRMNVLFKKSLRDSFSLYYMIAVALSVFLLIIAIL